MEKKFHSHFHGFYGNQGVLYVFGKSDHVWKMDFVTHCGKDFVTHCMHTVCYCTQCFVHICVTSVDLLMDHKS